MRARAQADKVSKVSTQRVVGTGNVAAAPHVGVIGGGQLARMLQEAAIPLGVQLDVLVESMEGAAGQVIPASREAQADNREAILALAERCDALTVEHEHVPEEILSEAASVTPVYPPASCLLYAQDKLAMREKMHELGLPNPRYYRVRTMAELEAALAALGGEAVVKTPRDGYDGKGVAVIREAARVESWLEEAGEEGLLVEERLDFVMEVAQMAARRPSGDISVWPLVQTIQQEGACFEVIAPAPLPEGELAAQGASIAAEIASQLGIVGVFAVEMFVVRVGGRYQLVINELAMRPHNSAHWTIEGARTSQFEQHLRAVLDLPLGDTSAREPYTVMVNVLGSALPDPREAYPQVLATYPNVKMHIYGKEVKPRRKIGHVTASGENLTALRMAAHGAAAMLRGEEPARLEDLPTL